MRSVVQLQVGCCDVSLTPYTDGRPATQRDVNALAPPSAPLNRSMPHTGVQAKRSTQKSIISVPLLLLLWQRRGSGLSRHPPSVDISAQLEATDATQ